MRHARRGRGIARRCEYALQEDVFRRGGHHRRSDGNRQRHKRVRLNDETVVDAKAEHPLAGVTDFKRKFGGIVRSEVGPRDGLQAEEAVLPLQEKIRWIEGLLESGVDIIQLGSFVHQEKVPQMADTDALFQRFANNKPAHVTLSGLVLNEKGLERGLACGVEMFCMGVSASETHSQKNTGMTTTEAINRIIPMAKRAFTLGKKVQASVQSAFGCGFEGPIDQQKVLDIIKAYLDAGIRNVSLADTAGHAQPQQVEQRDARELPDPLPVPRQAHAVGLHLPGEVEAEDDRACRLAVL